MSTSGCAAPGRPRVRCASASPTTHRTRSTKSVSDVYAPLAGSVVARNEALDATPELVNSDPYGEGWLFEIVPSDAAAVDALMDAEAYRSSVES